MMVDFNINYGLSTELFIDGQINPDLIIEEGCWYLCTDSAELFIGASVNGKLTLKRINEAEIHQIPVDNLALKSDVESAKQEVIQTVAPDVEAVKTKVETVLIPKVEEEIAPTVEELKTWVENKEFLQHIDLNGYATEQWVTNQGYIKEHQDISHLALKSEIPTKASELENDAGYITTADLAGREVYTLNISGYTANQSVTPEQDLILSSLYDEQPHDVIKTPVVVTYVKDTQLDDNWRFITSVSTSPFTGMYDKYLTLYSSTEMHKGDTNNTFTKCVYKFARNSYSTAWFLVNAEKLNLENVATEQFVKDSIDAINIPETDLSNYYNKSETETLVNEAVNGIEIPEPEKVDLTGYATEEWVENKKYLTEHQDLSDYAKKTDIPTDYLTSIPDEYVTETELANKGYLTDVSNKADAEHKHSITDIADYVAPDLSEYAKLSDIPDIETKADATHTHSINDIIDYVAPEIPSLEGYATKQDVADAISNIDFPDVPEVNLDNYYTKTETADTIATAIAVKANDVLFTTNKFVNNTIGAFVVGENLNGLTIAELFAKLLGLSDEPSLPEEPTGAIARIMASQIPMYSINGYTLTESPYQLFTYDESTKDAPIATSGFYQVTDNAGTIVEAGYQDVTIAKDDVYYMIALPSFVDYNTMVTLQVFDELNNKWVPYDKIPMISDIDEIRSVCSEDPQMFIDSVDLNEYTIWMSEETPTGKLLRYVINE